MNVFSVVCEVTFREKFNLLVHFKTSQILLQKMDIHLHRDKLDKLHGTTGIFPPLSSSIFSYRDIS